MSEVSMPSFAESWGQAIGKMGFTGSHEDVIGWVSLSEGDRKELQQAMVKQVEVLIPSLSGKLGGVDNYRLSEVLDAIAGLERQTTLPRCGDGADTADYPENNVQIGES